jgi:Tol biopolymer transport system component
MIRALALGAVSATLLAAAPAHATLVYTKNVASTRFRPSVWVANDDGTAPRRLVTGRSPRVSPDGTKVLYALPVRDYEHEDVKLRVVATAGGTPRTLLKRLNGIFTIRWSSDSRHVLALGGPRFGPHQLKLLDAATGAARTLARGYFFGFTFSPDGQRVVYSRATHQTQAIDSDLYVAAVAGGAPTHIATSNPALFPLWGPQSIVYSQARVRTADAPAYQLHRVNPDGSANARITRTKVPRLVWGLTPTGFSADGARLLAQFGGQDTSYAVAVDPLTGVERVLGPRRGYGLVATAISKDGQTVLAASGGFDESAKGDVVTVPWTGGRTTVLVRNADEPDWNR